MKKSVSCAGESRKVIGLGATTVDDSVAEFSGVGPRSYENDTIKPDVSAPGHLVCSASHLSDGGYVECQRTSMACSPVAGLVALLLNKEPNLSVFDVRKCIKAGAVPTKSTGKSCDGLVDANQTVPKVD